MNSKRHGNDSDSDNLKRARYLEALLSQYSLSGLINAEAEVPKQKVNVCCLKSKRIKRLVDITIRKWMMLMPCIQSC